ncbi:MAG: N-acetyltransferase [Prevotella sp.]
MSFLKEHCSLFSVNEPKELEGFNCGNLDLDDFFTNDCFAYDKQLLGKTYCYRLDQEPHTIVYAFTLANAGIRVSDLPNARRKKIESHIPHTKSLKDYPAVLVARLGVSLSFRSKHIGSDVLENIKYWFLDPYNKTGCRYVLVDAYNSASMKAMALPLYSAQKSKKKNTAISTRKGH